MSVALIAIGSNLAAPGYDDPVAGCEAALKALEMQDIRIARRSAWYRSAPVPASDQPDFVNGLAVAETTADAVGLLAALHRVEDRFGRRRSVPNAARTLDLDLIDLDGLVRSGPDAPLLPHPRLRDRAFVLLPLAEIVPGWRHPVTGECVEAMVAALGEGQCCCLIPS